jgi:phenylpyruvate tautomerase PptA (4-oxalocrotonate tautomerase family)
LPYLSLDLPQAYHAATKRRLARRIGDLFAEIMQTTPEQVSVAFRELGPGNLWRCGFGEPEEAAVLMCDIRRGRPAAQRARLAAALVDLCCTELELDPARLAVEFTQHAADEMYKRERGGLGSEWTPTEAVERDPMP